MITEVTNLSDPGMAILYRKPPREAVVCAYAQFEKGDYCTWLYDKRYGHMVKVNEHTVSCGNMTALLEVKTDGE